VCHFFSSNVSKSPYVIGIQGSSAFDFLLVSLLEDGIPNDRIEFARRLHLRMHLVVVVERLLTIVFRLLAAFVDVLHEFDVLFDVLFGFDDGAFFAQRVDVAQVVDVIHAAFRLPHQRNPVRHESVLLLDPLSFPLVVPHLVDVDVLQVVKIRRFLVDSRSHVFPLEPISQFASFVLRVVPTSGPHHFRIFPIISRMKLVLPTMDLVRRARHG